jgi:hypothetical protein
VGIGTFSGTASAPARDYEVGTFRWRRWGRRPRGITGHGHRHTGHRPVREMFDVPQGANGIDEDDAVQAFPRRGVRTVIWRVIARSSPAARFTTSRLTLMVPPASAVAGAGPSPPRR